VHNGIQCHNHPIRPDFLSFRNFSHRSSHRHLLSSTTKLWSRTFLGHHLQHRTPRQTVSPLEFQLLSHSQSLSFFPPLPIVTLTVKITKHLLGIPNTCEPRPPNVRAIGKVMQQILRLCNLLEIARSPDACCECCRDGHDAYRFFQSGARFVALIDNRQKVTSASATGEEGKSGEVSQRTISIQSSPNPGCAWGVYIGSLQSRTLTKVLHCARRCGLIMIVLRVQHKHDVLCMDPPDPGRREHRRGGTLHCI
jgi:hypothetical protein